MFKIKSEKGFTLVEMLVVVAIIAILASIFLVGLRGFRGSAYDSKRLADLQRSQSYLEIYYSKNRSYPTGITQWSGAGGSLQGALAGAGIGVTAIPNDPQFADVPANNYGYKSCDSGQGYVISAFISANSSSFKDAPGVGEENCDTGTGFTCADTSGDLKRYCTGS
ncbi:MAG: type II secretion system protein [Candidatus Paceibacterota bacterium]|jgi:prepilin-type N-terminal cleavage/methylation domain-containing protein